jgi:nitrite reductase (NADH) large subunit
VLRDATAGVYKRLVIRDNRIIGTVLYGETADGAWFNDLKKKGTDISAMRDTLIFGQAYQGGSPLDPMAAVAALPDDAEICGCNGVCKGKITGAIAGLTSLDGAVTPRRPPVRLPGWSSSSWANSARLQPNPPPAAHSRSATASAG